MFVIRDDVVWLFENPTCQQMLGVFILLVHSISSSHLLIFWARGQKTIFHKFWWWWADMYHQEVVAVQLNQTGLTQ